MSRDIYHHRHKFAARRRAFVTKQPRPVASFAAHLQIGA
jgi:hypothetical protein